MDRVGDLVDSGIGLHDNDGFVHQHRPVTDNLRQTAGIIQRTIDISPIPALLYVDGETRWICPT